MFHNFLLLSPDDCFLAYWLKEFKNKKTISKPKDEDGKFYCSVCGCEISEEDYESYDGMCWECWDDQLTEESETMFGDVM